MVIKCTWIGGNAWFGSIKSCIELKKRLGLYSTAKCSIISNEDFACISGGKAWSTACRSLGLARRPMPTEKKSLLWHVPGVPKSVAYLVSLCSKTVRHGMNMLSITFRE
jgi:hypothetical protein